MARRSLDSKILPMTGVLAIGTQRMVAFDAREHQGYLGKGHTMIREGYYHSTAGARMLPEAKSLYCSPSLTHYNTQLPLPVQQVNLTQLLHRDTVLREVQ